MSFLPPLKQLRLFGVTVATISLAACATGSSSDSSDPFDRESNSGRLHSVNVPSFNAGSMNEAAVSGLFSAVVSDTGSQLRGLTADDFKVSHTSSEVTPAGLTIAHVQMRQQVNGVPVHGSYVSMSATPSAADGKARLLASSHHVYGGIKVDTDAKIDQSAAQALARKAVRVNSAAAVQQSELVLWPMNGGLELVWSIRVDGSDERALVHADSKLLGRVTRIDERYYETSGTVTGPVAVGGAPGANGVPTTTGLPSTAVNGDGVSAETGADGSYTIDVPDGSDISAGFSGVAGFVVDQTGLDDSITSPAAAVTDFNLGDEANILSVANATAYYYTDLTLKFLQDNGVADPALLNFTINTNINDSCNAFYNGVSINFFQAGGTGGFQCNNTAEATIVHHEYGHFVDDIFGGITNGGLSEGWGDVLACYISGASDVGPDFFVGEDGALRTCDNDYQYPPGGNDSVHNLGQAWSGFTWHAREGLIAELGEVEGEALARALVLPSLPSNAADIPAAVREVFLRDDDDGDISNKTPHWDILLAAADLHSLGFIAEEDLVAPSAITDLAAGNVGSTTVELTWTATGDDNNEGTAKTYDIRRSSQAITDGNFGQATVVAAPEPLEAGESQSVIAPIAPGDTAFFAIRVFDEQGNGSGISNVVEVTADEGQVIYEESFETGAEGWEATGLWHLSERKASDGATAFWYGLEETGNYNTPDEANMGDLLSPPIDLAGAQNPVIIWDTEFDVEAGNTFDSMTIVAFDVDDPTVTFEVEELEGNSAGFQTRLLGLNGITDRTIQVRFSFATGDAILNETEGWFIDRVRVVGDGDGPSSSGIVINEVMADPGTFDSNNDGFNSFIQDEYVELVNSGTETYNLSGVTIEDSLRVRFTFPVGASLAGGEAVTVFGGGGVNIGTLAYISTGLYLNNKGDTVIVRAADGSQLSEMTYGRSLGSKDQSMNREVDGDSSAAFVLHQDLGEAAGSPGYKFDGTPFGGTMPLGAQLIVNEVLADPGNFDANKDGTVSATGDEFIELVNIGDAVLDLSSATYADGVGVRMTFPQGLVLEPGQALVIFGGGTPNAADFGTALILESSNGLFINNGGDSITIVSADGETLAAQTIGNAVDMSMTREVDMDADAPMVAHGPFGTPASPGTRNDGSVF